jgi:hypothetical protein
MLRFLKSFFGKHTTQEPQAPYKVELPAPATVSVDVAPIITQVAPSKPEPARCGCGRSTTGFCVGLHKLTAEEWAAHPDNKSKPTAPKRPAVKKPVATKQPAVKQPVAKKAPAKKKSV